MNIFNKTISKDLITISKNKFTENNISMFFILFDKQNSNHLVNILFHAMMETRPSYTYNLNQYHIGSKEILNTYEEDEIFCFYPSGCFNYIFNWV